MDQWVVIVIRYLHLKSCELHSLIKTNRIVFCDDRPTSFQVNKMQQTGTLWSHKSIDHKELFPKYQTLLIIDSCLDKRLRRVQPSEIIVNLTKLIRIEFRYKENKLTLSILQSKLRYIINIKLLTNQWNLGKTSEQNLDDLLPYCFSDNIGKVQFDLLLDITFKIGYRDDCELRFEFNRSLIRQ
jgi:hypothetical protein